MFHLPFDAFPLMRPFVFAFDPELAHNLAIKSLKNGLIPNPKLHDDPVLHTTFCEIDFPHPIGMAAGFDKQAEIMEPIFSLGFSSLEIGGVTPVAQPGSRTPRLFRISQSKAIINRFNLNSVGFDVFLRRLEAWYDASTDQTPRRVLGVNVAHGDSCKDDVEAFISGLKKFAPYVQFVTLNVSCPNEPGSRQLEAKDKLKTLLDKVKEAHNALKKKPLLLVKISPDQTEQEAKNIAEVVLSSGIDGMIVSNTTATRPEAVTSMIAQEKGGLSGKPLFEMSTKLLGTIYQLTEGKIPLIGSGGVFTGKDAYAKIRAGATLIQIYTAMVFRGPYVVSHITDELTALLKRDGFSCVNDAVGADYRKK